MINKLRLSEKFLRRILYARHDAIGIGLIRPKTAINTLVIKLYISYQRANSTISNMTQAINQQVYLEKGLNINKQQSIEQDVGVWIEYVHNTASKWNIKIVNQIEYKNIIIKNKTVMDIA